MGLNPNRKPDAFERGHVYVFKMPPQMLEEYRRGEGRPHERQGTEQADILETDGKTRPHRCVVISSNDFNAVQARGLVVIPLTTAHTHKETWVRVMVNGEAVHAMCEQIRYIDQGRYIRPEGKLMDHEMKWIEAKLDKLLRAEARA